MKAQGFITFPVCKTWCLMYPCMYACMKLIVTYASYAKFDGTVTVANNILCISFCISHVRNSPCSREDVHSSNIYAN